ncbi:MAG TPA: hypothetical protein VGJ26_15945 [Pirellulales bacterium]
MLRAAIKRIRAGQITLRAILGFTTLVAVGLAWWVPRIQRPQKFEMAGKQLLKQGAPVVLSGAWGNADLRIVAAGGDRKELRAGDVDVIRIAGPIDSISLDSTANVDWAQMLRLFRIGGLTELDVEANKSRQLDDVIEAVGKARAGVEHLRLSYGPLSARCGDLLANVAALRTLHLELCQTAQPSLTIDRLAKLEKLSLERCAVGRLTLESLPQLVEFNCLATPAGAGGSTLTLTVSDMPQLRTMSLATGSNFKTEWSVDRCPKLRQIRLSSMAVDAEHLERLASGAGDLRELMIEGVYECLCTPREARHLARLTRLETIRLTAVCPSRSALRALSRLPGLQRIEIQAEDCREDDEPRWYDADYNLSLEEHRARWASNAWSELKRSAELTDLALWTTLWNPQDIAWIGRLSKLKRLDLSRCRVKIPGSWQTRPLQESDLDWLNDAQGLQTLWLEASPGPQFASRLQSAMIRYGNKHEPFQ